MKHNEGLLTSHGYFAAVINISSDLIVSDATIQVTVAQLHATKLPTMCLSPLPC